MFRAGVSGPPHAGLRDQAVRTRAAVGPNLEGEEIASTRTGQHQNDGGRFPDGAGTQNPNRLGEAECAQAVRPPSRIGQGPVLGRPTGKGDQVRRPQWDSWTGGDGPGTGRNRGGVVGRPHQDGDRAADRGQADQRNREGDPPGPADRRALSVRGIPRTGTGDGVGRLHPTSVPVSPRQGAKAAGAEPQVAPAPARNDS